MNVTNLSKEERLKLFQEWMDANKKANEEGYNPDITSKDGYYLTFGHDYDISKEELEDPNFYLIEWGESSKLPYWMRQMADKIGKRCTIDCSGETGIFLGFTASYEDFYYRIKLDTGENTLETCVSNLLFG